MAKLKVVGDTAECRVDASAWMRSVESAYVKITSPSGRSITISKMKTFTNSAVDNALLWKCVTAYDTMTKIVILTFGEMIRLKEMSKPKRK